VAKHNKTQAGTLTLPAPVLPGTQTTPDQDVVFLGWQQTSAGDTFPLYNILKADHPSHLSTVTEKTLQTLHLRIPRTPSPYPGAGPSPWHTLGFELNNPATAREAIVAAGLDYTVVKKPLKEVVVMNLPAHASDRLATVRTDTGDVLGIVPDSYEPIQNRDAFAFFDSMVRVNEATYETAGVIGRGERAWLLAKLPGYIKVRGNDIVSKYILLSNSHDGKSRVRAKLMPVREVCNNTLNAALHGAGEAYIRRTSNRGEDMEQALALLGISHTLYDGLDAVFNGMARTKITDKQLLEYVTALIPDEGADAAGVRGIRDACLELYDTGQGADLSRGTLWGAFNSVTEYTDHEMDGNPTTRLESMWFGRGEQLKLKAFQLAESMM